MGGIGSGRRWRLDSKETTANYRAIDIRKLKRSGFIDHQQNLCTWEWSCNGEKTASIIIKKDYDDLSFLYNYRSKHSDWESITLAIPIDWTTCHYGGRRPWFLCPAQGCGRRVAILYCGKIFACRHCYQLAYPSQHEQAYDRHARRAEKIREKLDWEPGILNPASYIKPKGMHWTTYYRLVNQHDYFQQQSFGGILNALTNSDVNFQEFF